jgi:iron complex outermembrane receptor protein
MRRVRIATLSTALIAALIAAPGPGAQAAPQPGTPIAGQARALVSERVVFMDITVVITAARHEQKASEAPASVVVITAEEIARHGYRTLSEALQTVPGFYVNYDRNYTYIGVRGFARPGDYNSRVQIQINGHPMNDNVWDYAGTGEDQSVDLSLVERIEVVYGPGSALYGSNALFATINVITREAQDLSGAELAIEGGSFGRGQVRLAYGREGKAWKVSAGGSATTLNGDDLYYPEYDALGQNGGIAEGTDFEDAYRFHARLERGPFTLQASSSYRIKGIPTGAFFTVFNDDASRTTDARNMLEARYQRPLGDRLRMTVRGSYNEYRYWGVYRYDAGGGLLVDNIDRSTGRWLAEEAQFDYQPAERHRFTFGQSFVRNFEAEIQNFDEDPSFEYTDVSDSYSELSIYAQHEYRPRPALSLTSGVRFDDYSVSPSALSPRFGVVWAPRETWRVKFMAGRAFRAPNFYELFWNGPTGVAAGQDNLDPETLVSYGLAFETRLGQRFDLHLGAYRDRIRDLIGQVEVAPGVSQFQNVEEAETFGGELLLRGRFATGLHGYLGFSYMHAEDGSGEHLSNYPTTSYKAGVSVPFAGERWWLSSNLQYYEERLTLGGGRSHDFLVVNATLLAPLLHRNLRLSASVFNLLDREYALPASAEHQDLDLIPQDGRSLVARLLWTF